MSITKFTVLATLAAAGVVAFAAQDTAPAPKEDTPAQKQVKAQYAKLLEAYTEKKVDTVMNLTVPTFTWTLIDGKNIDRDKAKSTIKDLFESVDSGKWELEIDTLNTVGSIATSVVEFKFKGQLKDGKNNRTYPAEMKSEERHTWGLEKDGWKLRKVEILGQQTKTNGIKSTANVAGSGTGNPPPKQGVGSGGGLR
jgi:ketosteroid isomerase-like protein